MAFWSDVYPNRTTIASPTTNDKTTTIASGLFRRNATNRKIVVDRASPVTLLDVPQPAQPFLNLFFRSVPLIRRQNLVRFFLEHMNHKLINRLIPRRIRTLLHLLQQFTFNLDFVRPKHIPSQKLDSKL